MPDVTKDMDAEEFLAFIEEESKKPLLDESIPVIEDTEPEATEEVTSSEEVKEADDNIEVVETDGTERTEEDIDIDQEQQIEPEAENEKDLTEKKGEDSIELEELRAFRDSIVGKKITVDGIEIDGLSDPEAILMMQEKYASATGRLDQLNESRPVLEALRKNGLLDDKEKLALVLEAASGNKEAMKQLMKNQEVDPFELDMENIDGTTIDPSKHFASDIEMQFDDMINEAEALGVESQLNENVIQKWDNDSITKLIGDGQSKQYLMRHIKDGSFDKVNAKIKTKEFSDLSGKFKGMTDFDKYVIASNELAEDYKKTEQQEETMTPAQPEPVATKKQVDETEKRRSDEERLSAAEAASKASETVDKAVRKTSVEDNLMAMNNDDFLAAMRKNL